MQPASDTIMITLCSQAFTLKASLRAAILFDRQYGGLGNLYKAIAKGSFTAYQNLIAECCTDIAALNAFLKPFHDPEALMTPLGEAMLANQAELLEFVLMLSGAQPSEDQAAPAGETITLEELHKALYRLATGWLGWSPGQALDASPSEITEAVKGRRQMLVAIFGSGKDDQAADVADGSLASIKGDLNAIGDLTNHIMGPQ